MQTRINELLNENRRELLQNWSKELQNAIPNPDYLEEGLANELFRIIFESIKNLDTETSSELHSVYSRLMNFNISLNHIVYGFQAFRRVALKTLLQEDLTKEDVLYVYNEIDRWFDPILAEIINDCANNWEDALLKQKEEILELSAPAIQLFEKIVVMPLVGSINEERATTIMEILLEGIEKHKAEIVFLDVSGVPTVDTFVAQTLINSTRAARLLGTESIIVGLRPEIAQTIIGLGIHLDEIKTFGSLNSGLQYALNKMNKQL
ncbi:STAS domain-containing protein [Neobacillus notoginsengisoli]|uniref:STAS domain-containing protein n=1 Tax=Neobacillus notoginsengisoli TaxID=1578198 RepID=A0A417YT18_9BACI|nr:STAS domain-containing protein [Neobacillus notoginsengisoli]RHW39113.1 STAS domain-containing protein [Neobacillus notoginsengisoli]